MTVTILSLIVAALSLTFTIFNSVTTYLKNKSDENVKYASGQSKWISAEGFINDFGDNLIFRTPFPPSPNSFDSVRIYQKTIEDKISGAVAIVKDASQDNLYLIRQPYLHASVDDYLSFLGRMRSFNYAGRDEYAQRCMKIQAVTGVFQQYRECDSRETDSMYKKFISLVKTIEADDNITTRNLDCSPIVRPEARP